MQKYILMRGAGFTHKEAENFINRGVKPNLNSNAKQEAYKRLTDTKGETNGNNKPMQEARD